MNAMSRTATHEYILRQQEDYIGELDKRKKSRILDDVCRITGLERKYASKLLRGKRVCKIRPGRGKTYSPAAEKLLFQLWVGTGCPCTKYLVSLRERGLKDLAQLQNVPGDLAAQVLSMSASTMDRILRGKERPAKVWGRRNRRSGANNEVKNSIPCESGERTPACEVPPGDIQVDSVALCGGSLEGDFFWVATATDRRTQWFESRPSFNLCSSNYLPAFSGNLEAFPFSVTGIHSDNGAEFMNAVIHAYETGAWPKASIRRSWPGRKNHNAHIEQKNGSVVRAFVGDIRVDRQEAQRALTLLLEAINLYNNYFRPCVMLIGKKKRSNGKGCCCRYDQPRSPAQRALESGLLTPEQTRKIQKVLAETNVVHLTELIQKRRAHLLRLLHGDGRTAASSGETGDSALRAAPSGPSSVSPEPHPRPFDGGSAAIAPSDGAPSYPRLESPSSVSSI